MDFWDVLILGLVEGVTEFLPVSSTGHLILTSSFLNIENHDFLKTFDVFIQLGAISSILKIYLSEILQRRKWILELAIGFLPVAFIGFFFGDAIRDFLFNTVTVCIFLIVGGIFLIILDRFYSKPREYRQTITFKDHFLIGLIQCLAILPGFSRSTSCLVGGMARNIDKKDSIKISFLYGLPALYAAAFYSLLKLDWQTIESQEVWWLILGTIISFISSYYVVKLFLKFLEKKVLSFFGYYRIILAIIILIIEFGFRA